MSKHFSNSRFILAVVLVILTSACAGTYPEAQQNINTGNTVYGKVDISRNTLEIAGKVYNITPKPSQGISYNDQNYKDYNFDPRNYNRQYNNLYYQPVPVVTYSGAYQSYYYDPIVQPVVSEKISQENTVNESDRFQWY